MMKEFLRPKLNLPIILLVIIAFVFFDQWAIPKIVAQKVKASPEYRIPINFTLGQLKALIDQVNDDHSPKIILTGDSIIQGGGVGSGEESIAYFLQQELQQDRSPYKVYNLGISGAAPADVYYILKSLQLSDKDIVVYDLNIGHYAKGKKAITYPAITAKLSEKYHHGQPIHSLLGISPDSLEDRLQHRVAQWWKFYAYREVVKSLYQEKWFGHAQAQPKVNLDPWFKTDWTEKTKNAAKRGVVDINVGNVNLKFTKFLIEAASEQGARVFVFNIPLNQEMMAKYQMIDRMQYDKNLDSLVQFVTNQGAVYQDYELLIPSPHFTDSLHPMAEGNRRLAGQLHQDLQMWVNGKEIAP